MSQSQIRAYIEESARVKQSLLAHTAEIQAVADLLKTCVKNGGRIYTCGNGGSTCDAMHFVEELVARYKRERPGIPAHHLCDASTLTCWSNDYSFDTAFERQVTTLVTRHDVLVVFSTSGNSKNILGALGAAKKNGAKTVALLGKAGGEALKVADASIVVKSQETNHIQEAHIALVHIFCELLEAPQ